MKIDYENARVISKTVDFEGETEDGKGFTITANWNDWDDWTVDDFSWHDEEGDEAEEEQIKQTFMEEMT